MSNIETYILNIGLVRRDERHVQVIPARSALDALQAAGFTSAMPLNAGHAYPTVFESDTEPTLVVTVSIDYQLLLEAIWKVCHALGQEAIAVWRPHSRRGSLYGPGVLVWGDFDPDRFIMPDGARLSK